MLCLTVLNEPGLVWMKLTDPEHDVESQGPVRQMVARSCKCEAEKEFLARHISYLRSANAITSN